MTPFIKPLVNETRNGIFYAFQSGVHDSDLCNSSNNYRFVFSKYALLNIPNVSVATFADNNLNGLRNLVEETYKDDPEGLQEYLFGAKENYRLISNTVQFNAVGDTVMSETDTVVSAQSLDQSSKYLAESFQNYCLNMEAVLLSQNSYNHQNRKRTVAERIFFKWLKELGAIRYEKASPGSHIKTDETNPDKFFVEEVSNGDSKYQSVVKYINDIQAVYSNTSEIVSTEIYIYVPTEQGSSPYVLFNPISDDNYHYCGMENNETYNAYTNPYLSSDASAQNYLCGRTDKSVHPIKNLETIAYYDRDAESFNTDGKTDIGTKTELKASSDKSSNPWYDGGEGAITNSYVTDSASQDKQGYIDGNYFKSINQLYKKSTNNKLKNPVYYLRNTLDGVSIDFDVKDYFCVFDQNSGGLISSDKENEATLNDLNIVNNSKNFEFNCILIYYDLVNTIDPSDITTNLYGVYFLNSFKDTADESTGLYRDEKYKQGSSVNGGSMNGNALAYKINVKTDTSFENAEITPSINTKSGISGNTFSMDLFIDAMTAMRTMANTYSQNLESIKNVSDEISELRDLVIDTTNVDEINERLENIENLIGETDIESVKTFTDTVSKVYDDYNSIISMIKNEKNITLSYEVNDSFINSIVNHNETYNITDWKNQRFDFSTVENGEKEIKLNKYSNYLRHKSENKNVISTKLSRNITLKIDDSENPWQTGQTLRITFENRFDADEYMVSIVTDKTGKSPSHTSYGVTICTLEGDAFEKSEGKPIFEIVCVDATNMEFVVDQIK